MKNTTLLTLIAAWAFVFTPSVYPAGPLEGPGSSSVPGMINYQGRVTVGGVNFTGTGQFKFALVDAGVNQNQAATAFVSTDGNSITNVTLLSQGSGYTAAPAVTISAPDAQGGTQATAVAVVANLGSNIARIEITNPGSGYTNAFNLTITIAPPPANLLTTTYWSNDGTSAQGSAPANAVALGVNAGLYAVPLGDTTLANMVPIPASVFQNPDVRLRVWFNDGSHGSQLLSPDQRIAAVGYAMMAGAVPDQSITSAKIASGAVALNHLADGAVGPTKIAAGAVGGTQIAAAAIAPAQINADTAPQAGQVLSYDAANSTFHWTTAAVSLPFNGTGTLNGNVSTALFRIANGGSAPGIAGQSSAGAGLYGFSLQSDGVFGQVFQNTASGVYGRSDTMTTGQGVYGYAGAAGVGVLGVSEGNDGISGRTNAAGKSGVFGFAARSDNNGMAAINTQGTGIFAKTDAVNATAGFFWNSAGGDALRATGNASITGTVTGGTAALGINVTSPRAGCAVVGQNNSVNWNLQMPLWDTTGIFQNPQPDKRLFIVGNGSASNQRKNIVEVWDYDDSTGSPYLTPTPCLWVNGSVIATETLRGVELRIKNSIIAKGDLQAGTNLGGQHTFDVGQGGIGVNGFVNATSYNTTSDRRLKSIGANYASGLDAICTLQPLHYHFLPSNPLGYDPREDHVGLVAQEVQAVLPDAVKEGENHFLAINDKVIEMALINSVKQLKTENDDLRKRLEAVEAKLK